MNYIKQNLPLILGAGLIILGYFFINLSIEHKALSKSHDSIVKDLEQSIKYNEKIIDSLHNLEIDYSKDITESKKSINGLLDIIDELQNKPDYDTSIDDIHDDEHISDLFSRYYPDNN